jgi:hypothetical protein
MQGETTLKRHEVLMGRMARTLGADLDEAELRGDLRPEERFDMLLSCTGCADAGGCAQWLDTRDSAKAAPGYCRNSARLEDLARRD